MHTFPILGGKLHLHNVQPRPTEDPLWLAATMPALPAGARVLDAGSGSGIAALALLTRQPHLHLAALDIDPANTALATQNAALNKLPLQTITADILTYNSTTLPSYNPYQAILCNPPYHGQERGHTTLNPTKKQAHSLPTGHLTLWLHALTRLLTSTGTLHLVLHAACLPELTTFAAPTHTLHITPLQTSLNRPPKRLLATLQASPNPTITINPPLQAHLPAIRRQYLF